MLTARVTVRICSLWEHDGIGVIAALFPVVFRRINYVENLCVLFVKAHDADTYHKD